MFMSHTNIIIIVLLLNNSTLFRSWILRIFFYQQNQNFTKQRKIQTTINSIKMKQRKSNEHWLRATATSEHHFIIKLKNASIDLSLIRNSIIIIRMLSSQPQAANELRLMLFFCLSSQLKSNKQTTDREYSYNYR